MINGRGLYFHINSERFHLLSVFHSKKNNVALVVMKPSLRPVFYWADAAEANFLVRKKQYNFSKDNISIARILVDNKIANLFTGADSVLIFDAPNAKVQKFGNAIHRDADVVCL